MPQSSRSRQPKFPFHCLHCGDRHGLSADSTNSQCGKVGGTEHRVVHELDEHRRYAFEHGRSMRINGSQYLDFIEARQQYERGA